jgi:hypothetical protein
MVGAAKYECAGIPLGSKNPDYSLRIFALEMY